jgi:hypothetical protein
MVAPALPTIADCLEGVSAVSELREDGRLTLRDHCDAGHDGAHPGECEVGEEEREGGWGRDAGV